MIGKVISAVALTSACIAVFVVPAGAQPHTPAAPVAQTETAQSDAYDVEQFEMRTFGSQRGQVVLIGSAPFSCDWATRATDARVFVDGHRVNAQVRMKDGEGTIIDVAFLQSPGTYTVIVELVMKGSHKKVAVSHPVVVTVTGR